MKRKMKILIDNGHGEETAGKRSPDGKFREYRYAREIAAAVVNRLNAEGYDAELLVPETSDVSLSLRCKRANRFCDKLGTRNVLVVSVHVNAAGDGSQWLNATGFEVWTYVGQSTSDILSEYIYDAAQKNFVAKRLRVDNSDGDRDKEGNLYILKHTKCAAVLTENFFMDNHADVDYLLSPEGREAVVKTHVEGIAKFINR